MSAKLVPTFLRIEGVAWSAQRILTAVNFGSLDRSRYFSIQVAPQLSSRGSVDPVPDPLLLKKSGSAGNRTRDLMICSQELTFYCYEIPVLRGYASKINVQMSFSNYELLFGYCVSVPVKYVVTSRKWDRDRERHYFV
jgi:hypothetical protein